ncbi:hypothetical protein CLV60_12054 [Dyadobacter jiangsuensis]|uniref:Uncharacterized protein n=1 Tax=Dyadobacter jiangsuensis TaxID=1591085 RepID=A0A2P8FLC0_9BACT|nr:hypothetical protein CLV60_12054 [Dyadobacter jiangsuensis]
MLIAIQGCKSPDNYIVTPESAVELPQSVRDLVYKSYPSASNLKGLSEIEKGRVYELFFESNNAGYNAIVGTSDILRVDATVGEAVPDSLVARVQSLAIRGGKLTNYRRLVYLNEQDSYGADYELNGLRYLVRFVNGGVRLTSYEKGFVTREIQDLPDVIQEYIAARNKPNPVFVNSLTNLNEVSRQYIINNNELVFSDCTTTIMPDGSKQYMVSVKFLGATSLPILFKEDGQVIWIGAFNRIRQFNQDFNGGPGFGLPNLTSKEITYFRDLLAASSQFMGFNLDNFVNFNSSFRNEYEDNRGYTFDLSNDKNERWYLCFNGNKELVYSLYSHY